MWALPVRLEMSCTIIDAIDGGIVSALLDAAASRRTIKERRSRRETLVSF
jgi:hypothetical protein